MAKAAPFFMRLAFKIVITRLTQLIDFIPPQRGGKGVSLSFREVLIFFYPLWGVPRQKFEAEVPTIQVFRRPALIVYF